MASNYTGNDFIARLGQSAAATTPQGGTPAYGMAFDMASGQWVSARQFQTFAENAAQTFRSPEIQAQAAVASEHDHQLTMAQQFQNGGLNTSGNKGGTWFSQLTGTIGSDAKRWLGDAKYAVTHPVLAAIFDTHRGPHSAAPSWDEYKSIPGALLTRDEYESLNPDTRAFISSYARGSKRLSDIASVPGIKQGLQATGTAYRGAVAAENQVENTAQAFFHANQGDPLAVWFSKDRWSQAWKDSQDQSFGSALVNTILSPVAKDDQLDEWAKHSSIYQLTAAGSELAVGWEADPTVLAGKAGGSVARLALNERFLNEGGTADRAMQATLQGRERITVRTPVGVAQRALGEARARSWFKEQPQVEEFLRNATEAQATGHQAIPRYSPLTGGTLKMMGGRSINGDAAMMALKKAVDIADASGDRTLLDLTWGAVFGDPKAYSEIRKLNILDPEDVVKYDRSGQWESINDAVNATKTLASDLQAQITDLQAKAEAQVGQAQSWNWITDRDIASRQADLAAAQDKLARYEGYQRWAQNAMPSVVGDAAAQPQLARVQIPRKALQGVANPAAPKTPRRRFFMDNQFGLAHSYYYVPRAAMTGWKASTISAHDLGSGPRSFERQMGNLKNLFGYEDPDGSILSGYIRRWHDAPTETDRIYTAAAFEHNVVMDAVTKFYNRGREADQQIDPATIQAVYQHVVNKQNETVLGLGYGGDQSMYAPGSAQSIQQRATTPGSGVELVNNDGQTVTLHVQGDAGDWHSIQIPHEQWTLKPLHNGESPLFETQTANFYNPIDAWRFHAELQRDPEFLHELNADVLARGRARVMAEVDHWGTKFNRLWKPLTLFRLGWPMRVLMDESMRGLAMLGPVQFAKNYGAGFNIMLANGMVKSIDNAEHVARWLSRKRAPQIGPGPLRTTMRRTPLGDLTVSAPVVPEEYLPHPSTGRLEGLQDEIAAYRQWERDNLAGRQVGQEPTPRAVTALQSNKFVSANGEPARAGQFVPLEYTSVPATDNGSVVRFLEQYAPALSDSNFVVGLRDGRVFVARRFKDSEMKRAASFHHYVNKDVPDAAMWTVRGNQTVSHRFDYAADDTPRLLQEIEGEWRPFNTSDGLPVTAERSDRFATFDAALDSKSSWVRRKLRERRELGQGYRTLVSSDGKRTQMPDAYEGHLGQVMYSLTGSEKTIDAISEGHGRAMSWMRGKAIGHKTYSPAEFVGEDYTVPGSKAQAAAQEYFGRWADMVNDQLGSSQVAQKVLSGMSDNQVGDWLANTTEGQRVARQIGLGYEHPALYVNQIRDLVNRYVPSLELQRRLVKGRLSVSDLRRHVADEDLPDVFGPEFDRLDGNGYRGRTSAAFQGLMDKAWSTLGSMPIDYLSRHPFYRAQYNLKMRNLIRSTDSKWIDDDLRQLYERQAHGFASDQVRRHLWDLTDQTNFAEATRFLFPFWAAQREAIAKWAQIVFDRPETVARFMAGQRAVYRNFLVVNQNGEPVSQDRAEGYHPNDRVIVQIPKALDHLPGFGKALREIGSVGIPIGSANTVIQGNYPFAPGAGPLVTIPADKLLRWQSQTLGIPQDQKGLKAALYNYLFPIGRPRLGGQGGQALNPLNFGDFWGGIAQQVLPGWAKRVQDTSPGLQSYNNFMLLYRQMQMDAVERGEDPKTVSIADVAAVKHRFDLMKAFAGITMPFQVEFRPKDQFYLDQYHAYQRKYGPDADQKFLDHFGPLLARQAKIDGSKAIGALASYTTSSTSAPYGTPPTAKGLKEAVQNKDLLDKYGENWGSFIESPDAWSADFSYDAYAAETQIPVSPGSSETLRQNQDPEERARQADITAGWYEYRKLNDAIQAELANRGLTSITQNGAEDLQALKAAVVRGTPGHEGLAQQYPAWFNAYTQGATDIYVRMKQLREVMAAKAGDDSFNARPDVQGMRQYLLIRQKVTDILDAVHAAGGSWNLQAQENAPLRDWFYNQVGQLMQENPAFSEVYTRYLEGDTLEQGSGGLG